MSGGESRFSFNKKALRISGVLFDFYMVGMFPLILIFIIIACYFHPAKIGVIRNWLYEVHL